MTRRLLYLGSPEFAVPPLKALIESKQFEVIGVLTQPDKPEGRGHKLKPTPVKKLALEQGIKVIEPKSLKKLQLQKDKLSGHELAEEINALGPIDAAIVVAYGKIIPKALIDYPKFGAINIHPSLLPRWRGAAPIQHTLFAGDKKTGSCIMQLDEGLDTGPVFACEEFEVSEEDDLVSLHDKLSTLSTKLLLKTLPKIFSEELRPVAQVEEGATYAEKWDIEDRTTNWNDSAATTARRLQASMVIRTSLDGEYLKIHQAKEVKNQNYPPSLPGQVVELNKEELVVQCGEKSFLSLEILQFPGKKALPVSEILKSAKISKNSVFK